MIRCSCKVVFNREKPSLPRDRPAKSEKYMSSRTSRISKKIVALIKSKGAKFFCDQFGLQMAFIMRDDHFECWSLRSKPFQAILRTLCEEEFDIEMDSTLRAKVIERLRDEAQFESIELSNRFAATDGSYLLDVANSSWQQIEISAERWVITDSSNPVFRRYLHQRPLPEPVPGGDPFKLFEHLAISCEKQKLLVLSWLVSSLNCNISTPIMMQIGPQGACKSTTGRRLRSLLDPSIIVELGECCGRDLLQIMDHHAVPMLDNVGHLNRGNADTFCRVVTGGGIQHRRLYTDDEPIISTYRRSIIMNGLHLPSLRADFLDRCIILRSERQNAFEERSELDAKFEQDRPSILGSLLDLFVKTLQELDSVPATREFRLADFARFGRAVAVALGQTADAFDDAYRSSMEEHQTDVLENCVIARTILELAKPTAIQITSGELLELLKETCAALDWSSTPSDWPKSPRCMSVELEQLSPMLLKLGVSVERLKRTSRQRMWEIKSADPK
jgi:hypothetical protein